jgi:hypothetical protein
MKQLLWLCSLAALGTAMAGCDIKTEANARTKGSAEEKPSLSPEEKKYLAAADPFLKALAARNYEQAYAQLSSHARARMSSSQFVPVDDPRTKRSRQPSISLNVTIQDFATLMQRVEKEHGLPNEVKQAHVFSTDPAVLSGKGELLDSMFAIGEMPASIPAGIRRASIRCQIGTKLTPEQLQQAAKDARMTPEQLLKIDDFAPYFNLKFVLVEEQGALRIGYFEFMPPSIFD